MKRFLFFLFLIIITGLSYKADAVDYAEYAFSPAWLKLLHYQQNGHKYAGLIANDEFYLSPQGKNNPQDELRAEISAFSHADNEQKCSFPARFNWLKEQGLVYGDLHNCTEYQQFIDDVQPSGITLLFTNAYMRNPASLFGHTLVRIDIARKGTQMLAHGSNFGANSGTEQGVIFALKGLFGGYMGSYNLSPYWNIINTYNNIENRDIWEYKLNLTDEEIEKFVNHLYEMRDAQIQYYFLSKNCSYMILELLEAVRPELSLTQDYQNWAIPLDTLKAVKSVPDLLQEGHYRPARYTKIQAQLQVMNEAQISAFKQGISNEHEYEMKALSAPEKAQIFEALYQYYQYKYTAHEMELKEYRRNSFAVLRRRSQLPTAIEPQLSGEDPTLSHASKMVAMRFGARRKKWFSELIIQPAYTGVTDNNFGLIKGSAIHVLENRWRYYYSKHRLVLQQLALLRLLSLVPSDTIFQPLSYQTDFSIRREQNLRNNSEGYVSKALFGFGKTYAVAEWVWFYGMLNAVAEYGGFIPNNQFAAMRPEIGLYTDFEKLRAHFKVSYNYATNSFGKRLLYHAEVNGDINQSVSLTGEYTAEHSLSGGHSDEYAISLRWHF